jgi:DNA-binding transcriptional ArsR family regulator
MPMAAQDMCEIFCFDEQKVNRVKAKLRAHSFQDAAQRFKVLADATRLKIAYALCGEDELCVCDAANIIGSTLATASHHLRLLRNMGIAKCRKDGKLVFYSLADPQMKRLIKLAFEQEKEEVCVE